MPPPARIPAPKPKPPAPAPSAVLSSLLEPFQNMPEDKQGLLRDVLQIYVSKDAAQRTDLDKRHRVTTLINTYAKGEEAEE
jgi:hypothetical protein